MNIQEQLDYLSAEQQAYIDEGNRAAAEELQPEIDDLIRQLERAADAEWDAYFMSIA